jgi:hypothetical protein
MIFILIAACFTLASPQLALAQHSALMALIVIAACFTLVSPQLALAQHSALMALYDALGLATVTEKRKKQRAKIIFLEAKIIFLEAKIIFLEARIIFLLSSIRLFSCIVCALCGDCTVLSQWSGMFWEQRDCCVRMKVCLCVV